MREREKMTESERDRERGGWGGEGRECIMNEGNIKTAWVER